VRLRRLEKAANALAHWRAAEATINRVLAAALATGWTGPELVWSGHDSEKRAPAFPARARAGRLPWSRAPCRSPHSDARRSAPPRWLHASAEPEDGSVSVSSTDPGWRQTDTGSWSRRDLLRCASTLFTHSRHWSRIPICGGTGQANRVAVCIGRLGRACRADGLFGRRRLGRSSARPPGLPSM